MVSKIFSSEKATVRGSTLRCAVATSPSVDAKRRRQALGGIVEKGSGARPHACDEAGCVEVPTDGVPGRRDAVVLVQCSGNEAGRGVERLAGRVRLQGKGPDEGTSVA